MIDIDEFLRENGPDRGAMMQEGQNVRERRIPVLGRAPSQRDVSLGFGGGKHLSESVGPIQRMTMEKKER